MLLVLFDKNVPYPLKRYLTECRVATTEEEGWDQISNGDLIERAEKAGYQILLTCDQNLRYQQNLARLEISIVVLGSTIWPSVQSKVDQIAQVVARAEPGSFDFLEIAPPAKQRYTGEPREQ